MHKSPEEPENTIREQFRRHLKETLASEGQKRWTLLEDLASEHGYHPEDRYSYRDEKSYLMKIGGAIIYLENISHQAYGEIRELLEKKDQLRTSASLIGNALTVGSSTLGGALLGYLLIQVGLHPLVLVPAIIIPPSLCIYNMLKQGTKEADKLAQIEKSLERFKENIFYDDAAIRRLNSRIYRKVLLGH